MWLMVIKLKAIFKGEELLFGMCLYKTYYYSELNSDSHDT